MTQRIVSDINTNMTSVTEHSPIPEMAAPGSQSFIAEGTSSYLTKLTSTGKIKEGNKEEGFGPFIVVLADVITGSNRGDYLHQGDVVRLSQAVTKYSELKTNSKVKDRIVSLVNMGVIRPATSSEIEEGKQLIGNRTDSRDSIISNAVNMQLEDEDDEDGFDFTSNEGTGGEE